MKLPSWKSIIAGFAVLLIGITLVFLFFDSKPFNAETEAPQVESETDWCEAAYPRIQILKSKIGEDENRRIDYLTSESFLQDIDDLLLDTPALTTTKPESRRTMALRLAFGAARKARYNQLVDEYNVKMKHVQWYYSKGGRLPRKGSELPWQLGKLAGS